MRDLKKAKKHFLKNDMVIRLGCIAGVLGRLESFSRIPNSQIAMSDLANEGRYFIEWTLTSAPLRIRKRLANLQSQLALCGSLKDRERIAKLSGRWAKEVLKLSGLLL